MVRKIVHQPTEAELTILKVIWNNGPCTVREVHESLEKTRRTGYTTTLKQLQVMTAKGLVERNENQRSHIYEARLGETQALRRLAADLLRRFFDGSAQKLIMHALSAKRTSADELEQIRKLLENLDGEGKEHDTD